jgi:O-methyltransferase
MLPTLVGDDVLEALAEVSRATPPGCFIEVGVYKGGTGWLLSQIAEMQGREIYLYDTFTGIPYTDTTHGDSHRVGDFSDTSYEAVKDAIPYAHVIQGIFPESAVDMGPIGFIHLDCDQYQSYKDAFDFLIPKCQSGTVIWFDDYCLMGAAAAVNERFSMDELLLHIKCNKTFVRIK